MILITPIPLVTNDPDHFWALPLKAIADIYRAGGKQITELRITANIEFNVVGFDVKHYCHYFMEETATDVSPAYVVYTTEDEAFMREMADKVHWFYKNSIPVSLDHPQTYEEAMAAKAVLLSRSIGGKGLLIKWENNEGKLIWRIGGGKDNHFKDEFFKTTRSTTMRAVSND